eukprot:m.141422 g.141422  ORF g.141422 m.141422 type:complete len:377 (+) comp22857_c0_seq1:228-1358(+)
MPSMKSNSPRVGKWLESAHTMTASAACARAAKRTRTRDRDVVTHARERRRLPQPSPTKGTFPPHAPLAARLSQESLSRTRGVIHAALVAPIPMSLPLENNIVAVNPNPSTVAIPSRRGYTLSRCDPRIEKKKDDHDVNRREDADAFGSDETLTESSSDEVACEVHGAGDAASQCRPAPPTRIRVFFSSSNGARRVPPLALGDHTVRHRTSADHPVGHLRGDGGGGTQHAAVTVPKRSSTNLPASRSAVSKVGIVTSAGKQKPGRGGARLHRQQPRKMVPSHLPEPPKKKAARHREKSKLAGDGIDGAGSTEPLPELDETVVDSITFVAASRPPPAASLDTTAGAAPTGTVERGGGATHVHLHRRSHHPLHRWGTIC